MASKFTDTGGNTHISGSADIYIDADGGDIFFQDGGTSFFSIANSSSDAVLSPLVSGKDIEFTTQAGDTAARVDSSDESFDILRKFKLGVDSITSDATLTATEVANIVVCSTSAGTVTGTLANPTFNGQFKIVMGVSSDGGGTSRVTYNNPAGSVTKSLTSNTGIILFGVDLGGGTYRWMLLGDVS